MLAINIHSDHYCQNCGTKYADHALSNNPYAPMDRCPRAKKGPSWPTSIRDEAKAGALFDVRLQRHWQARTTIFKPV